MDTAGMVMFAVGLVLVVFAPVIGVGFWRRWRQWPRAVATVTKVKERKRRVSGNETTDIWVTYRFTDAAGEGHSASEYRLRRPEQGAEFTVRYDPEQPEDNNSTGGDRPLLVVLLGVLPAAGVVLVVWGFLRLYGG